MAIQTVYCANSIFKDIVENQNKTNSHQMVYSILDNYSDIVLDLEENELDNLIEKNEIYKYFIKRDVGELIPYKDFFENLKDEDFASYPTEIFLLENETIDSAKVRKNNGCLLLNSDELGLIEEIHKPFGFDFKVQIPGLERVNENKSWEDLLEKVNMNPINTAILTDSFIYKNQGEFNQYKVENLFSIIKSIIPDSIESEFQVIIVIDNSESVINKDKANNVIEELQQFIKEEIGKEISVGIITHTKNKAIHERAILSNHHYLYSDKGFNIWLDKEVKYETKGKIEWLYNSVSENTGTIRKVNHFDYLSIIKKQRDDNENTGNVLCFNQGNVKNRLLN